jgi:hypothetical protein
MPLTWYGLRQFIIADAEHRLKQRGKLCEFTEVYHGLTLRAFSPY